jgi:hypothetical protein
VAKVLLLWSGGVESTSSLKWALENSDDEIFAHHLAITNVEGRNSYEERAIRTLTPLLAAIRPFHYDSSVASVCNGEYLALDRHLYQAFGTLAMMHHGCFELRRGYCAEDQWAREWLFLPDGRKIFHYVKGISLEDNYLTKAEGSAPFLPKHVSLSDITKIHETAYWTKAKHCAYLGDMLQYTWSCRTPTPSGSECGSCHSCVEKKYAMKGSSNVPEIARRIADDKSR